MFQSVSTIVHQIPPPGKAQKKGKKKEEDAGISASQTVSTLVWYLVRSEADNLLSLFQALNKEEIEEAARNRKLVSLKTEACLGFAICGVVDFRDQVRCLDGNTQGPFLGPNPFNRRELRQSGVNKVKSHAPLHNLTKPEYALNIMVSRKIIGNLDGLPSTPTSNAEYPSIVWRKGAHRYTAVLLNGQHRCQAASELVEEYQNRIHSLEQAPSSPENDALIAQTKELREMHSKWLVVFWDQGMCFHSGLLSLG